MRKYQTISRTIDNKLFMRARHMTRSMFQNLVLRIILEDRKKTFRQENPLRLTTLHIIEHTVDGWLFFGYFKFNAIVIYKNLNKNIKNDTNES